MARARDACWRREGDRAGIGLVRHCKRCRPGRPLCRWSRAQLAAKRAGSEKPIPPCDCPAYKFLHRPGSGICGDRDAFAAKVYGVRSTETYAEAAAE